jgi:hypothetical protein
LCSCIAAGSTDGGVGSGGRSDSDADEAAAADDVFLDDVDAKDEDAFDTDAFDTDDDDEFDTDDDDDDDDDAIPGDAANDPRAIDPVANARRIPAYLRAAPCGMPRRWPPRPRGMQPPMVATGAWWCAAAGGGGAGPSTAPMMLADSGPEAIAVAGRPGTACAAIALSDDTLDWDAAALSVSGPVSARDSRCVYPRRASSRTWTDTASHSAISSARAHAGPPSSGPGDENDPPLPPPRAARIDGVAACTM